MQTNSLTAEVETFLYSHAPNLVGRRELLNIIRTWETAYLERIRELEEVEDQALAMANEGGTTGSTPQSVPSAASGPQLELVSDCGCGIFMSCDACRGNRFTE